MVQEALTNVVAHAEAQQVRVGVFYGSDDVVVVVEDDGAGFDVDALKANRRAGLGLNGIVARAHQLGADLEIESNPGWGTRVRAKVPYDGSLLANRAQRGTLWRLLIVHHHAVVRAGLVRLLGSADPQIQVVGEIGDARDVVDAVRVLEPDVVLLELEMPGLDGARLTSYIRAGSPTAAVLLMAGERFRRAAPRCDQLGRPRLGRPRGRRAGTGSCRAGVRPRRGPAQRERPASVRRPRRDLAGRAADRA